MNSVLEMFLRAGDQEVLYARLAIYEAPRVQLRTHCRPTCSKVAAILLDDNTAAERDIILHQRGGGLQRTRDRHTAYVPLHFLLLFRNGEPVWQLAVQYQGDATIHNSNRVSCCEFVAYRFCIKTNGCLLLHHPARLFLREFSILSTAMHVPCQPESPGSSRLLLL